VVVRQRIQALLAWLEEVPELMVHRFAIAATATELTHTERDLCHDSGYHVLQAMEAVAIDDKLKALPLAEVFVEFRGYFNHAVLERHVLEKEAMLTTYDSVSYDSVSMLVALKADISKHTSYEFSNLMPSMFEFWNRSSWKYGDRLPAIQYMDKHCTQPEFAQYLVRRSGWVDALRRDYKEDLDKWLKNATDKYENASERLENAFFDEKNGITEPEYKALARELAASHDDLINDVLTKMTHPLVGAYWDSPGHEAAPAIKVPLQMTQEEVEQSAAFLALQATCEKVEGDVRKLMEAKKPQ
jgi:hypothetical protein